MRLDQRVKSLIKVARLVSSDDSGNYSRGVASYMGVTTPVLDFVPYGLLHRPPANSMCLVLSQNGQESNAIAIISDPKRRTIKDLLEGECALNNQTSGDYVYLKDGNEIEIKTSKVTILTGATTVTIEDGQVTIDGADATLNGSLQVNGDIGVTGTITGDTDVVTGTVSLLSHTHVGSPTAPSGAISPTGTPV